MNPLSFVELDTHAFEYNINCIRQCLSPETQLCLCVKANAYGHGLESMILLAESYEVDWLAVVNVDEIRKIRATGCKLPALVMGYVALQDLGDMVQLGARLYVWDESYLRSIQQEAQKKDIQALVHIPIETGMGRLGVHPQDLENFIGIIESLSHVTLEGISQHYATGDEKNRTYLRVKKGILQK